MMVMVAALVLAVFALPSALNLPQANPGQTLEYAPVPGAQGTSQAGNFAGLGLGQDGTGPGSAGSGGDSVPGLAPPPPPLLGAGGTPTDKQCVGNPPRQTEDPLSPPCVAYFKGDNGGATYPGVTSQEVPIVFYFDGGTTVATTSRGSENTPVDEYDDMSAPAKSTDHVYTRVLRDWQVYFNHRYQTYNRTVHFYAYYSRHNGYDAKTTYKDSPADRRADAAGNYSRLHPFAAFAYPAWGHDDDYTTAMAQKGVLSFGGTALRLASFYTQFPRLLWGFRPTIDEISKSYASYVCTKVLHQPVNFAGDVSMMNRPRKFGFLYTTDPAHPELQAFGAKVKQLLQDCGVSFGGDVMSFPYAGWDANSSYAPTYATTNMAKFSQDHVTTVLWPAGLETNQSQAADQQRYYPEWITGGDYLMEGSTSANNQNRKEWSSARAVTPLVPSSPDLTADDCTQALRSVDPAINRTDVGYACSFYEDIRQMMTGIQVAGPRLSPTTVDQGFHAIPRHESSAVYTPACFYETNDYTCVKDAIAEWFDANAPPPVAGGVPGCWRMFEGGRRHIVGGWPAGNVPAPNQNDPCNVFGGGTYYNIGPPTGG